MAASWENGWDAGLAIKNLVKRDLDAHGMAEQDQTLAIDYARDKGWLQFGPDEEVQITDKGFVLDWGQ